MRQRVLPFLLLLTTAAPAFGQVTVDLKALDPLPGANTPPPPMQFRPREHPVAPRPAAKPLAAGKPGPHSTESPTAEANAAIPVPPATPGAPVAPPSAAVPAPPAATLPTGTPPTVALAPVAPPAAPSAAEAPPPPPPPIVAGAPSTASAIDSGLRVTFGADKADLSPDSANSIKSLVQASSQSETTTFNVVAYAAGTATDPSASRRMSLARALAIRSALIADGVPSTRIYVRALGSQPDSGPPDRADISVLGSAAQAAPAAPAPAPPPAAPAAPGKSP